MGRKLGIYDIISLIFVVLTVGWLLFVITRLLGPEPAAAEVVDVPTPYVIPTFTPSRTPLPTLPPTFTPTSTFTEIPTNTPTLTPTIAPSTTITETLEPSLTPTVTPTLSPTPSETPSGPTTTPPSPYLYELPGGQVVFVPNTYNSAGCAWQGIGGQVFGLSGTELNTASGLTVHVFQSPSGIDARVLVGSNSIYGVSGWEVAVDSTVNANTYFVQLETQLGTQVSDIYSVMFPADCQRNVALLRFRQIREQ